MQLIKDIKVTANDIKKSTIDLLPTFKDLGVAALKNMKSGYFMNVVVVFIVAILISAGYNYTLVNNLDRGKICLDLNLSIHAQDTQIQDYRRNNSFQDSTD